MKITSTIGTFKIIQTVLNKDELLILSKWDSLCHLFESQRIFLVNKQDALFGTYLCKQECAQILIELIQKIDYRDWDHLNLKKETFFNQILA